jgi:hypothetical protein
VTAAVLLQRLRDKGVEVRADGDRLRLSPASALLPEELEQAKVLKPDLIRLLVPRAAPSPAHPLRLAIRRWFALTVVEMDGRRPSPSEVEALRQEIFKLEDETGPAYAEVLIREEARRFRWETARCGWCGNLGHDGGCGR